ncbi:hypothetical protein [Bacillus toyonensis]|uniref:hypothetical protein n=1 Tax=Bacillus toyonensis TaxID=155322 RepID=UPI000BEE52D3|nr:hypothetical protein [Bacillus toyonensis]PDZ86120.1 hypothetical protein CON93_07145 [Bacillus toyonensis]PEA71046.1 hypothetical protein COO00_18830 [Bacillus toyonensis]
MLIVNKGTSIGWSPEELKNNDNVLGLFIVSVLDCILDPIQGDVNSLRPNYQGLVKEARTAMVHDIHGLAILSDMIQFTFENQNGLLHKHFMYVVELIEKYFTNIRSIYDFMAKILRLAVEEGRIGQIPFGSLNDLINYAESNPRAVKNLPEDLIASLKDIKAEFYLVRGIRDFIIHNGKQISLLSDKSGYQLGPFDDSGTLAELNPGEERKYEDLMPYLSERTNRMLEFGEIIGGIINREFRRNHGDFPFYYCALQGVCIPSFVSFLGLKSMNPK